MPATRTENISINHSKQFLCIHRHCRHCRSLPLPVRKLKLLARKIFSGEHLSFQQSVSVVFCSDYYIRRLNARYLHRDRVTDVLSFTINDPDLLGEIYISLPRASIQARLFHASCEEELLKLFVHGLFHLLGYDHKTLRGRRKMELKEKKYTASRKSD
jgi:probable rRNA maturation factor